jgi:hypothetical protein
MHDLPPDAKKVLDLARGAGEPSAGDYRRVHRALIATLAATGVAGAVGSAKASFGSSAAAASSTGALKLIAVALAVTTAGGLGAWQLTRESSDSSGAAFHAPASMRTTVEPPGGVSILTKGCKL